LPSRTTFPVEASTAKPYSIDRNLLHTSYEGGILEDPDAEPPAEIFQRTVDPRRAPDQAREVAISFERGTPVAVDGKPLSPAALLTELNKIAGEHGVGRADVVEDRFVGMKSRGVYETPGGTLLYKAHRGVASLTMDREAMRLRDTLAVEYATLVYRGFWFSPEREALQKLVDDVNQPVTGTARLRLYKGSLTLIGRKAPKSLYRTDVVTFEDDHGAYDQRDAGGFIRLNALRLRTTASARLTMRRSREPRHDAQGRQTEPVPGASAQADIRTPQQVRDDPVDPWAEDSTTSRQPALRAPGSLSNWSRPIGPGGTCRWIRPKYAPVPAGHGSP
jgi:argininosuccinate synthase